MRRSVRCSCVRITKALAFLRNGRYHIPASPTASRPRFSVLPNSGRRGDAGERGRRKNNHFVIPFPCPNAVSRAWLDTLFDGARQNVLLILSFLLYERCAIPMFAVLESFKKEDSKLTSGSGRMGLATGAHRKSCLQRSRLGRMEDNSFCSMPCFGPFFLSFLL